MITRFKFFRGPLFVSHEQNFHYPVRGDTNQGNGHEPGQWDMNQGMAGSSSKSNLICNA